MIESRRSLKTIFMNSPARASCHSAENTNAISNPFSAIEALGHRDAHNVRAKGLGTARQIVHDHSRGICVVWADADIVVSPIFPRDKTEGVIPSPTYHVFGTVAWWFGFTNVHCSGNGHSRAKKSLHETGKDTRYKHASSDVSSTRSPNLFVRMK
jgi:hypothetical protein